jgi:Holliday junction DNA helicase RuvA
VIASLSGTVSAVSADGVVVEVSGVGYLVRVPTPLIARLSPGKDLRLETHLVVREDGMTLYGFDSIEAAALFRELTKVSGVGPKLALSVLSTLDPPGLRRAVASGDVQALMEVPGVGKRGAQRMLLELKERLGVVEEAASGDGRLAEAREALMGLGYSAPELREVLATIDDEDAPVEDIVKKALKELARV